MDWKLNRYDFVFPDNSRTSLFHHAGYVEYLANYTRNAHVHEYYQFLLVMKGDMFLTYGEESVHLTRGMVSILAPGVSHSVYMVSDCTQFGADLYCRDEDELSVLLQENIPTSFIMQYEEGISFCEAMRILARKNDRITKQMFFTKTSELLLRILSRLNDSWESRFQEQLELYLSNNLQRNVSVREIADRMNMSISSCERLCRRYYGCGLISLFRQMRAKRSCELLLGSDCSVKEIACQMGFHEAAHFTRFFKEITGKSPSAYRGDL